MHNGEDICSLSRLKVKPQRLRRQLRRLQVEVERAQGIVAGDVLELAVAEEIERFFILIVHISSTQLPPLLRR